MNKKKILLDRFIDTSLSYFYDDFKKLDLDIRIITYNGKLPSGLKNYSGKLLNDFEIARGSFFSDVPWVLESQDLEFFSKYEGLFKDILSRYALSPSYWSSQEMSVHATLLFNYWKYKLVTEKIEICFAFYAPHEPSSFSLYLVTKFLKIPYIFIDMPIIGQRIRFMSCSYKYRNLLIHEKSKETSDSARKILENHQYKITNNFISGLPPFMFENQDIFNKIKSSLKRGDLIKKFFSLLFPPVDSFFKYNRSEWYSAKAIPNWISFYLQRYKILRRISKRGRDYNKICSSFKNELINSRYIYFAAPLSPEGSYLPASLWNRHIKISILKLISVIPDDWKIIYKANPLQFSQNTKYRFSTFPDWFTSDFYFDLLKTKKVHFVSVDTPTKNLIENSTGVASICGTVSIEAITLGKHAITFSPMWYDEIEGIHFCKTKEDLLEAINLMKIKDIPVPKFSSVHLSSSSIFDGGDYINCDFSKDIYNIISNKFISSYQVFNNLDDKKWSI